MSTRSARQCSCIVVALILLLSVSGIGHAQEPVVMVKRVGLRAVVRVSPDGATTDTLFRTAGTDVFGLTVAPSGRFVGALEGVDRSSRMNRLVVVDLAGNVVRAVSRDVRAYVWCCETDQIAAITGTYEEARGFTPTGAFLIDVVAGTEQRLQLPGPYEVTWAGFDSALYFKIPAPAGSRNVVRYDPGTGESRMTDYRDLRFSPSGAFYLHYFADVTLGPPGPHIFERVTGHEMPRPDPSLGAIEGWVFDQGDYLRLKRAHYPSRQGMLRGPEVIDGYTIYDVRRGKVAARIQDSIRTDVVVPSGALVLPADGALRLMRGPGDIRR
jgi:hypothetical protein